MTRLQQGIGDERVVIDVPGDDARRRHASRSCRPLLPWWPDWTLHAISSWRSSVPIDSALATLRYSEIFEDQSEA